MSKRWVVLMGLVFVACSSEGTASAPQPVEADGGVVDGTPPVGDAGPEASPPKPDCGPGIDVTRDPKNCGACGRVCESGSCTAEGCAPTVVATNTSGYGSPLAANDTTLYWLEHTDQNYVDGPCELRTVPKAKTATVTSIASFAVCPDKLVVTNATAVFLTEDGETEGIDACTLPGCADLHRVASTWSETVATDDVDVFWSNGSVYGCPVAGCAGAPRLLHTNDATSLVADRGELYSIDRFDPPQLRVCAVKGCKETPRTVTSVPRGWEMLRVNATDVVFQILPFELSLPVTLYSCPRAGCATPNVVLQNPVKERRVHHLAVDDKEVFLMGVADFVGACPVTGCKGAPRAVVPAKKPLSNQVVDGSHVYFRAEHEGKLVLLRSTK